MTAQSSKATWASRQGEKEWYLADSVKIDATPVYRRPTSAQGAHTATFRQSTPITWSIAWKVLQAGKKGFACNQPSSATDTITGISSWSALAGLTSR
ncbi:MAG: hypothetical protein AAF542_21915 [Pseudomonadota bacterium]